MGVALTTERIPSSLLFREGDKVPSSFQIHLRCEGDVQVGCGIFQKVLCVDSSLGVG